LFTLGSNNTTSMSFLFEDTAFSAYYLEHLYPLLFFFLFGLFVIVFARNKLNKQEQRTLGVALAFIPFIAVFLRIYYEYATGVLTIENGLPLHLCRILAVVAPAIMFFKNRLVLAMFYLFALSGTLIANLTPDLPEGFPNLSYFCYWMLHSGLIVVALYGIFVHHVRVNLRDIFNVYIASNLLLVIMYGINYLLGSNYLYTMRTPDSASLLDHMGPWPWYLLSGQGVMLVLMFLVYIPFLIWKEKEIIECKN